MSLASRLRHAVEARMSINKFQEAMEKRGIRKGGTSYPQIHRYLNRNPANAKEPSVDFLMNAADLLGVRVEWLVSGAGFETEEEQERAEEVKRVQRDFLQGSDLNLWEKAVKAVPELSELNASAQMSFADSWRRYVDYRIRIEGPEAEAWTTMEGMDARWADTLADFLVSPFQQVGRDPIVESDEFTDYAILMLQALNLAGRVPLEAKLAPADVK